MPCPHIVLTQTFFQITSASLKDRVLLIFTLQHHSNVSYRGIFALSGQRFLLINIHETVGTEGHGQSMPKGPSQEASYWLTTPPRTALHAASSLAPSISSFGVFKPIFGSKLHRILTPQGNPPSITVTFPKELSHGQLLLVCIPML